MKKPNILIIMTDQQRYDSLGCYGADWIDTPNLDRLAEEGMLFENCYVNNPICTPSRASMFTGKHIPGHSVLRLHDILPDSEVLFTRHLQELGYTTALFGKLHVSGRIQEEAVRHPNDGFDIYEWCMEASISMDSPFNGYSQWLKAKDPEFHARLKEQGRKLTHIPREYHFTHWAAERTIDFIQHHEPDRPFFCMMSVFDPHNPYDDYPAEYAERVDQKKMPMPELTDAERHHTVSGLAREQQAGYLGAFDNFNGDDFRDMRTGYYGSLALLDDEVGRVLAALDAGGIADDTLVIFLSDHGDMLGDHGLLVKGAYFYDPCVKVPLIVRQPGVVPAGLRSPALVQPHDIAATVLAAAGADREAVGRLMPESCDIRQAAENCHASAVCAYRETGIDVTGRYFNPPINATMVTDGRYKLNVYHPVPYPVSDSAASPFSNSDFGVKSGPGAVSASGQPENQPEDQPEGQLFNLQEDPGEKVNLWDQQPEIRKSLMGLMLNWFAREDLLRPRRAFSAVPAFDELFDNRLK